MVTAALFTTAKTWKQPKCPQTDEWLKMRYVHAMGYYSVIKKNKTMPFAKYVLIWPAFRRECVHFFLPATIHRWAGSECLPVS